MISKKHLIAIGGLPAILGVLYLEEWLGYWLNPPGFGAIFILTALFGGWLWAINLPHPRQERKRREALALLLKAKENAVPAANATTGLFLPKEVREAALDVPFPFPTRPWPEDDKETLAEKRP